MPIYDYICARCDHSFELRKSWSDDRAADCPKCAAPAKRNFAPPAIIFKGGGFYTTDYARRDSAARSKPASNSKSPSDKADGGGDKAKSADSAKSSDKAQKSK